MTKLEILLNKIESLIKKINKFKLNKSYNKSGFNKKN